MFNIFQRSPRVVRTTGLQGMKDLRSLQIEGNRIRCASFSATKRWGWTFTKNVSEEPDITRYNQSTKTDAVKSEDEVDQTISNQKMKEVDPPGQCFLWHNFLHDLRGASRT